jgi:hypothetical protein
MQKHLIIVTTALIFVVLSAFMSIAQIPKDAQDSRKVENGFYLIRGQGSKSSDFDQRTDEERVVAALRSNDTPDNVPNVMYLVRSTPDIPLELLSDPKIVGSSLHERRLAVQLVDKLKPDLFRFTRDHLEDRIAIVVGNRVVMIASIRSPIADGRIEISACNGDLGWVQNALKRGPAARQVP